MLLLQDVADICALPRLNELHLEGTPLSRLPTYRYGVLSMLRDPAAVVLDGTRPSARELRTLTTPEGLARIAHACRMTDMLQHNSTLWQVHTHGCLCKMHRTFWFVTNLSALRVAFF